MKGTDQVSVEFTNNLIERFIKRLEGVDPDFKENPKASDAFRALPRPAQALKIRKEVDRDFKDPTKWLNDIQVKSDPKFIQEYRLKVWPVIRGHCATADCHGGADGKGHLRLFTGANNERAEYTNFIILDGFANADGRMFDRENSEDSLILQYGLPTEQAKVHHPKIARELKVFDDRKVKQYGDIESWIRSLRSSPHPDYFLAWKPPAGIGLDFGTGAVFKDLTPTTAPAKPK